MLAEGVIPFGLMNVKIQRTVEQLSLWIFSAPQTVEHTCSDSGVAPCFHWKILKKPSYITILRKMVLVLPGIYRVAIDFRRASYVVKHILRHKTWSRPSPIRLLLHAFSSGIPITGILCHPRQKSRRLQSLALTSASLLRSTPLLLNNVSTLFTIASAQTQRGCRNKSIGSVFSAASLLYRFLSFSNTSL